LIQKGFRTVIRGIWQVGIDQHEPAGEVTRRLRARDDGKQQARDAA
jgi:hypothetical protein